MEIGAIMPKVWNYARRAVKIYPSVVFGTGTESAGKVLKDTKSFKQFFLAMEKNAQTEMAGGFWKKLGQNLKNLPKDIGKSISGGYEAGGLLGGIKGLGKGFVQKLPLIGSLMILAFEIPNIFKATKNEGVVSGGAEAVKAAARIGGATVGAAIGSAFIPVVGGLIGWVVGEKLVSLFTGKSYSEDIAQHDAKPQAAQNPAANPNLLAMTAPTQGVSPPMTGMPPLNNWNDDFMVQNYGMNPFKNK